MDFTAWKELFKEAPELVVLILLLWFLKYIVRDKMAAYDTKIKTYDEHLKECAETPKKVIMEKLDDLCERIDKHIEQQTKMSEQVNVLVGRQQERDSH